MHQRPPLWGQKKKAVYRVNREERQEKNISWADPRNVAFYLNEDYARIGLLVLGNTRSLGLSWQLHRDDVDTVEES